MANTPKSRKLATKTTSKKRKIKKTTGMIFSFLDNPKVKQEDKDYIRACLAQALNLKQTPHGWDGYKYCPAGSVIDEIVSRFERYCTAPLELPFLMTMTLFSAILIRKNVVLNLDGNKVRMDIWVTALGESGACKSFSLKKIAAVLKEGGFNQDLIWEPSAISHLVMMQELAGTLDRHGNVVEPSKNMSVLTIDEATDFFLSLKDPRHPLHGMYQVFLKIFSNDKVGYKSKAAGNIEIDDPIISMLCLATPKRFIEQISESDMEGGFFYRWCHMICSAPLAMTKKEIFPSTMLNGIAEKVKLLINSIEHQEYVLEGDARRYFSEIYERIVAPTDAREKGAMPQSYIRRSMWVIHKFALLYHLFLGKGAEKQICVEAYHWAERLTDAFQATAAQIILEKTGTEEQCILRRVDELVKKRRVEGKDTTPRDLVNNLRIKTAEARMYLEFANMAADMTSRVSQGKNGDFSVNISPSISPSDYDEILKQVPKNKIPGGMPKW